MKLSSKTIDRLKRRYGNWALVTGATSGIGRELALRLGEAGFDLVITGRREQVLNELSTYLHDNFGAESIPLVGDLSTAEGIERLKTSTAHLPLGIVILNAGFGTSGRFMDCSIEQELNLLDLNCRSVLQLTHHYAQAMKTRSAQGAIVLLSSMVAFQGVPYAANYAASKAYVQSLGEALARELRLEGIDVLCVAPGPVESGFAQRADMKMGKALRPNDIGVPILSAIGRKANILPGFLTKILVYSLRLTPRSVKIRIMEMVMSGFVRHQWG